MKLVTYANSDTPAIGALIDDSICPFTNDASLPNEMKLFLEGGEANMNKATDLLNKAENLKYFKRRRDNQSKISIRNRRTS